MDGFIFRGRVVQPWGDIVGLLPAHGQWAEIFEWQAVRPSWKRKYLVWFSPALNFVRLSS